MIQLGDKVISREILENHFICHLHKCEGNCCVFGDSGAPLEEDEVRMLDEYQPMIKSFMRAEGIAAVQDQGNWVIDNDGDKVTPLVDGEECAYAVFEKGIARCSIEMANEAGIIPFQKPVSCHLYPIRVARLRSGVALNYHRWSICEPARLLGKEKGVPVFRFLRDALVRVFGIEFYEELESIYQELSKKRQEPIR
jgi:hypothetical protein